MKSLFLLGVLVASITSCGLLRQPIGNPLLDGGGSLAQFDSLQAEIDFLQSENGVLTAECDRLEVDNDRLSILIDTLKSE